MSTSDRGGALARRNARIADYIRQGKTTIEICDLEGLDPGNEPKRIRKEVADPLGLTLNTGVCNVPPVGLMDIPKVIRYNLRWKLSELRSVHHYVEIGRMLGMTNKEQKRADTPPYTHNWTLGQIQRLAVASNMTFEEMLTYMVKPAVTDFRIKK